MKGFGIRLGHWLWDYRVFWAFWVVLVVACIGGRWLCAVVFEAPNPIDEIRFAGWILDVAGIFAIVGGVDARLRSAERGSLPRFLWSSLLQLFRDFPSFRQQGQTVHLQGADVSAQASTEMAALGQVTAPDRTTEERLDDLEESVDSLKTTITEMREAASRRLNEMREEVEQGYDRLDSKIGDLAEATRQEQVQLVPKELAGIAWIFFGITLATVPELVLATIKLTHEAPGLVLRLPEYIASLFASS